MIAEPVEVLFRREHARVLASLIRRFGDLDLAEEALQDAYAKALKSWPQQRMPECPVAWLTLTAQRCALDRLRRSARWTLSTQDTAQLEDSQRQEMSDDPALQSGVEDDRLRLLFTCCHPALAPAAQSVLALRTLCGLNVREIARAFVEPEATTAQRLVRVKGKIAEARIPYEIPSAADLPQRIAAVLSVIYLVFNEGYSATEGEHLVRPDLCVEGIRLGRLVLELLPRDAELRGLLALMLLHESRRATRADGDGQLIALDEQDRSCWDRSQIDEGIALLDSALCLRTPGPYQIQAAIAALHAQAPRAIDTDWNQILGLYGALLRHQPTPVVELNAAVALAMAQGIEHGLRWIDQLQARDELADYHLLPAARADLLRRGGRNGEARSAYGQALSLARNRSEIAYLERRLRELPDADSKAKV